MIGGISEDGLCVTDHGEDGTSDESTAKTTYKFITLPCKYVKHRYSFVFTLLMDFYNRKRNMNKHLLFIQGGGESGYEADKPMVAALQAALGKEYSIHYPELQSDEHAPDFGWVQQIGTHIAQAMDGVILVAHSLGASLLLKYLSEHTVNKYIKGVFLLAAPFWNGNEDWEQGLKLKPYFAAALPPHVSIFFYQCQDDEEVPVEQLIQYRKKLPFAMFREFEKGGHQFSNNLNFIVDDIRSV